MKESTQQKSKRILDAMLSGKKLTPYDANKIGETTDGTRFIRFIREKYPVKDEKVEGELYHRYWIDEEYLKTLAVWELFIVVGDRVRCIRWKSF